MTIGSIVLGGLLTPYLATGGFVPPGASAFVPTYIDPRLCTVVSGGADRYAIDPRLAKLAQ